MKRYPVSRSARHKPIPTSNFRSGVGTDIGGGIDQSGFASAGEFTATEKVLFKRRCKPNAWPSKSQIYIRGYCIPYAIMNSSRRSADVSKSGRDFPSLIVSWKFVAEVCLRWQQKIDE